MDQREKMVFCTLFDSNYLDKGLALYASMKKNVKTFRLYIFAFDGKCFEVLSDMKLQNAVILSLDDIMTDKLRELQGERSRAEFCWTCTPAVIEHVLLKHGEKICTYIDADIYFFSSPLGAIQEILDSGCSVGLVEHRFERDCAYGSHIFSVGKYCIQFNTFLNDKAGIQVLADWKRSCLEWCYHRCEDGRLGDQKYPDKWKLAYPCIHEVRALGAGAAPWNLKRYSHLVRKGAKIWMQCRGTPFELIFYHFEGIRYLDGGRAFLNIWEPSSPGMGRKMRTLYGGYLKKTTSIRRFLEEKHGVTFEHMAAGKEPFTGSGHSLKHYCKEDGVIGGAREWAGHWRNNIVRLGDYH